MGISRRTFLISSTASVVTLYFCGLGQKTLKIGVPSLLWNSFVDASDLRKNLEKLNARLAETDYSTIELHKTENIYEKGFDLYFSSLSLPPLKQAQDSIFPLVGPGPMFDSIKDKESFLNEPTVSLRLNTIYQQLGYDLDHLDSVQTQNYCLKGAEDLPIATVKWSWNHYWKTKGMSVLPLATTHLSEAIRYNLVGLTDYFSNEYSDYLLSFNSKDYKKIKVDINSIHSFIVLADHQSDIKKNKKLYDDLKLAFRHSLVRDQKTAISTVESIYFPEDILEFKNHYKSAVLKYFSEKTGDLKISNLIETSSGRKFQGNI